ncbi:glycosyl hydrolase family 20 [Sediminihabitans luteus]|uniref:beta-N-acetylhexosaminidase n=1 Tax=Sediminihabitans luteus TaxID=1138585 RepID=A0A2M9CZ90_9CELL|nr:glycoside hydrolase family 20 zincin-like fold domain-containing protein [Sediminihabitans luteus]PJJ77155.1 glycosyl hydrolase family 20 [Sediminihabitans luteus]GII98603.1 hypothetical protein Slu03_09810 [Sediminihabitans luteus]
MTPALFPAPRALTPLDGPGVPADIAPVVVLDPQVPAQGYVLRVADGAVELRHADDAGLRYGRQTHAQLVDAAKAESVQAGAVQDTPVLLDPVLVEDSPDVLVRGFMLDVSRDRVPTRATLARVVELCAAARINQLQLYTEHTFAYADHEDVWRDASPVTADDMRWLDDLCDENGIELVANQNVFGHMERWLVHPAYQDRAEAPGGFTMAGIPMPSAVLEPTPDNADFAHALIAEITGTVRSRTVNIGADETFELGMGRSAARVEAEGRGAVYAEHLHRLVDPLVAQGFTVQYWADILGRHPEYAATMPEGSVPIVWLYDSPATFDRARALPAELKAILEAFDMVPETMLKGFADRAGALIEHGIGFWVAPGTSTWLSFVGRIDNAVENMVDAARTARRHGSGGYLNTQWGDHGMIEPPVFGFVPMVLGGAYAWCVDANEPLDVADVASRVVLDDPSGRVGAAVDRLGRLWAELGVPTLNASPLWNRVFPDRPTMGMDALDPARVQAVIDVIDAELASLARVEPRSDEAALCVEEVAHGARFARLGAQLLLDDTTRAQGVAAERLATLDALVAAQRTLWARRSRPGGLEDSLAKLEPLRRSLRDAAS